jgi:HSP20 family protein
MISFRLMPNPNRLGSSNSESPSFYLVNVRGTNRPRVWRPPTDVYEFEDRVIVRVEIAGMQESDFSINLDQNILTINGVRPDKNERRAYHQMEIPFGEFITEVEIHSPIDSDQVNAEYSDGFLIISLPKIQPRQITINKES